MILCIQNGTNDPGITKYLRRGFQIIKSFEINVLNINLDDYDIVIILGGNQSILEIDLYPYLTNVIKLAEKCIEIKKPLLGICLGSQIIAYALGCKIKKLPIQHIGYDVDILGHTQIFRYHHDYFIPNNYISVIEYFDSMPYFYKHNSITYGIQCHPDVDPETIEMYTSDTKITSFAQSNIKKIDNNNCAILSKIFQMMQLDNNYLHQIKN